MATQSPFSLLDDAVQKLGSVLQPPPWLMEEAQRRIVLLLNHVLMQEGEAMARLSRQQGRVVLFQWREMAFKLQLTPAGLLDLAAADASSDLTLAITETSPAALLQAVVAGERPGVRIEGDVQLAAEINWVVDHVRWDIEEDLSRLIGDAPAHGLVQAVRGAAATLQQWLRPARGARE